MLGFLSSGILKAQDSLSDDYVFVNSIFKNHIKSNSSYYYLYYKPNLLQFTPLKDSLFKYLCDTDILFIRNQIENPDSTFEWNQNFLDECRVIQEGIAGELHSKNTTVSAVILDANTNKPIKPIKREPVPIEERQYYSFSIPVWNTDKTIVIFGIEWDEGNFGGNRTYMYEKVNNEWEILTEMIGLDWSRY